MGVRRRVILRRDKKHWEVAEKTGCLSCGHVWTAIFEIDTDHTRLECPKCHEQNSKLISSGGGYEEE